MPRLIWCRLELQAIVHARCLAEASAGKSIAARMAMMAMTTSSSIKVKARCDFMQYPDAGYQKRIQYDSSPFSGSRFVPGLRSGNPQSRRKTNGKFHGGIFGMNFPVARADDERRLFPSLAPKPFWEIAPTPQAQQCHQRRIAFPKNHLPLP